MRKYTKSNCLRSIKNVWCDAYYYTTFKKKVYFMTTINYDYVSSEKKEILKCKTKNCPLYAVRYKP